jgi:hypothetical protein
MGMHPCTPDWVEAGKSPGSCEHRRLTSATEDILPSGAPTAELREDRQRERVVAERRARLCGAAITRTNYATKVDSQMFS